MMKEIVSTAALTLLTFAAPYIWPELTPNQLLAIVATGTLLIGLLIGYSICKRFSTISPKKTKTALRLQFFGNEKTPSATFSENIHYWYTLWSESKNLVMHNKKGEVLHQALIPKTWTIFIVFDKPILFRQIDVNFSSQGFPPHEVKYSDSRFAVVHIQGDIPLGSLEITALV